MTRQWSVCVCLATLGLAHPALGQVVFQGLGDLPGGSTNSSPRGISPDGSAVVGRSLSGLGSEAFRWTEQTGMVGLGFLIEEDPRSVGIAASEDGTAVVGEAESPESTPNKEPFRWTAEEGMIGLGGFPGSSVIGSARGVSWDGLIVVGSTSAEAFRWTEEEGLVGLGHLPGGDFSSGARGISADGTVIVGVGNSVDGTQAFRWTEEEGMIGLGDLPGGDFDSEALAVSADGLVIVGLSESANGREAFRWTQEEGMVGLGALPIGTFDSVASTVSADGSIVVGSSCLTPGLLCFDRAPFIWDAQHGMRNLREVLAEGYGLDLPGWTLSVPRGLSADGLSIVGNGANPAGDSEAWLVRLPDCNGNGIADDLDILDGISVDDDGNFIPDECDRDCNGNGQDDLEDIADGTSEDCNDNGLPDECEADCNNNGQQDTCDIADGFSEDCNDNDIPDECDADCNGNGQPDACDIADGVSLDCDESGVPDECETDCNSNGQDDGCDIEQGLSEDCNSNDVPDECEVTVPLSEQPQDQKADAGDFVMFSVETEVFLPAYQWRKEGEDLQDDGRILGSESATLFIFDIQASDAGVYDCLVTDPAGCFAISDSAILTVLSICLGDFDGDGVVGPSDLATVLRDWGPCPGCPQDLNDDGAVGPIDLAQLLGAWGPCP